MEHKLKINIIIHFFVVVVGLAWIGLDWLGLARISVNESIFDIDQVLVND